MWSESSWLDAPLTVADSKYQFMEVNTQRRAAGLKDKIPDIQKTLETVRFLKTRKARLPAFSQDN